MNLLLLQRLFGLMVMVKVIDLIDRDPSSYPLGWPLVLLHLAAGALLVVNRWPRSAALLVAFSVGAILVASDHRMWNHHFYLAAVIGLSLGLFETKHQPLLLKTQLTFLYGFAAISKINGTYFSGAVIQRAPKSSIWDALVPDVDVYPALSVAAVIVELFLAGAFWFRQTRLLAATVGAIFHLALVVGLSPRPDAVVRLTVFAGLTMILYIPFFMREQERAG